MISSLMICIRLTKRVTVSYKLEKSEKMKTLFIIFCFSSGCIYFLLLLILVPKKLQNHYAISLHHFHEPSFCPGPSTA